MRFFLAVLLAVAFNVSAYGQQSKEEQLADALRLIEQLELERDLAQLEADEAKLAARRDQIALRQAQLEIEQLKAQPTSSQVDAGTPTVEASVSQECSRSNVEACDAETLCDRATTGSPSTWRTNGVWREYSDEAKRRGLACGVVEQAERDGQVEETATLRCSASSPEVCTNTEICRLATYGRPKRWLKLFRFNTRFLNDRGLSLSSLRLWLV